MSTPATFLWHDYETFGVNPRVDRPAQFAAVRTDADFEPIGEPVTWYCQPQDDYLPEPEACLLTGITPEVAAKHGVPEAEFSGLVHAELSQPGTCGVGYNSMRFDDEVTRFMFWRNFIDPYRREWADGCSRWDLIDTVRMTYALRPEGIEWPKHDDGRPSFKLEHLSAANALEHAHAHDALSDVRATIGLARLIRQRQPRLFAWVQSMRPKGKVSAFLDLADKPAFVHVSARFGADRGCMAIMMPLAAHPTNRNSVICYDLSVDPTPLLTLQPGEIRRRLFARRDELPEGCSRIALKEVHLNRTPVIAPLSVLDSAVTERWNIKLGRCEQHRQALLAADELDWTLKQVYGNVPAATLDDAEHTLYDGFLSDYDRRQCERVRDSSVEDLADLAPVFQDKRLDTLLFRYKARNYPAALDADEQARWQAHCRNWLVDGHGAGLSLDQFMGQAVSLRALDGLSPERRKIVQALAKWGLERGKALL